MYYNKMTTTLVLIKKNPVIESSDYTVATFSLTDENGNSDNISNIKYLWMPQHPDIYKGNVLCEYLLSMIKNKLLIYSDLRGFMIFHKPDGYVPELYQGADQSWARIRLDFIDTNLDEINEGKYIVCSNN